MTVPFSKSIAEFFEDQGFKYVADRGYLPYSPGIYVVFRCYKKPFKLDQAECIYVGQTKSLRKRLGKGHDVWDHVAEEYRLHRIYYKTVKQLAGDDLTSEAIAGVDEKPAFYASA